MGRWWWWLWLCGGFEMRVDVDLTWGFLRRDAAQIVKTITGAVKYLHDQGIVHRGEYTIIIKTRWSGIPHQIAELNKTDLCGTPPPPM
jgi:hypothetical protein